MPLSPREQQILDSIEHDLGRGRLLSRTRAFDRAATRLKKGSSGNTGWVAVLIGGLLSGIGILSAGLALGSLGLIIGGAVLTQLTLVSVRCLAGRFPGERVSQTLAPACKGTAEKSMT
jgi:predicted lipid-binding transport protein (Tim44 family)